LKPISSHFKEKKPIQATFKVDLCFADVIAWSGPFIEKTKGSNRARKGKSATICICHVYLCSMHTELGTYRPTSMQEKKLISYTIDPWLFTQQIFMTSLAVEGLLPADRSHEAPEDEAEDQDR
jgi:hypothetical protein